jgi:hypothetical protein
MGTQAGTQTHLWPPAYVEAARALLAGRDSAGRIPFHPYTKWVGAHWVLAALANIGYPPGETGLVPLRDQVFGWLLSPTHQRSIKTIAGRVRRCASQEGNALYATLALAIADERADELAARLVAWQWPDGGWNCDKRPEASHSSFHESLIPLRGLALHARLTGSSKSRAAAERAAEFFLSRRLFRRLSDGQVIDPDFLLLHYPAYWHYDILSALTVLIEAGYAADPRLGEALDIVAARRLPGGGFPAEAKYYRLTDRPISGRSLFDWGPTGTRRANTFVTARAESVLQTTGRT